MKIFYHLTICPRMIMDWKGRLLSWSKFLPSKMRWVCMKSECHCSSVKMSVFSFCFPEKSISFSLFIIFCFLFQNVRHDVVYYYKPAPSNSLQPFEKFTNLPADRQLLLRSWDDFEESRRIYQTIASTWRFEYDNIFDINLGMDLIIEIYHISYLFCSTQGNE